MNQVFIVKESFEIFGTLNNSYLLCVNTATFNYNTPIQEYIIIVIVEVEIKTHLNLKMRITIYNGQLKWLYSKRISGLVIYKISV